MKFAHLADCHIGNWREPELNILGIKAFNQAIDYCIKENTAFILISGDLFNTSLPNIDLLKDTAAILRKLRASSISCYIIPGSHDYSPSGKTMLDVLENSGLVKNVSRIKDGKLSFSIDKTNVKITGMFGKKGGLESQDYDKLDKSNLENENGIKIFMFHSLLTELKPNELDRADSHPLSYLPKNFTYYAGGHPHFVYSKEHKGYGWINYPGPLFPANFAELEKLKHGGFNIIEIKDKVVIKHIPVKLKELDSYIFNADGKNVDELRKEIIKNIKDYEDKILTIRIEGTLLEGKPADLNTNEIFSKFSKAYSILKNTNKLQSKEFEKLIEVDDPEELEISLIKENNYDEKLVMDLMRVLDKEKNEGEKNIDFGNRVIKDVGEVLKL